MRILWKSEPLLAAKMFLWLWGTRTDGIPSITCLSDSKNPVTVTGSFWKDNPIFGQITNALRACPSRRRRAFRCAACHRCVGVGCISRVDRGAQILRLLRSMHGQGRPLRHPAIRRAEIFCAPPAALPSRQQVPRFRGSIRRRLGIALSHLTRSGIRTFESAMGRRIRGLRSEY